MAILALLRALPGTSDEVRRTLDVANPERLVDEARAHGLSGVLRDAIAQAGITLPPSLETVVREDGLAVAAGGLRTKPLLMSALDALAKEGITPVLLKGYAFGARFYPAPLLRPTSDVDLLVGEDELARAQAVVSKMGLKAPDRATEDYHRAHHHHLLYAGPQGSLELHFRPFTGFGAELSAAERLARAEPSELEGRAVRYLSPTDELLYLALHAAGHMFARLSWLHDIKLLALARPIDWGSLVESARRGGLAGPTFAALSVLARATLAPVDATALRALRPSAAYARVIDALFSDARLEDGLWGRSKWGTFGLTALLANGPGRGVGFFTHHLVRGLRRRAARALPSIVPTGWRG